MVLGVTPYVFAQGRQPEDGPRPFVSQLNSAPFSRLYEDDHGGFYMVWTREDTPKHPILYAQRFDRQVQGVWSSSAQVVAPHLSTASDWSGLADGQGGLTLFWDESDGIHAQRFKMDGTRMRELPSVLMSTATAIQPQAVPDASGGTFIVFLKKIEPNRSVLMAQHFDVQGQRQWVSGGIRASLRPSSQSNPRIVYDDMSGMIVAWRDIYNEASELRMQRVDSQGNLLWGPEGVRVTGPMGAADSPIIAPLKAGAAVVAWNMEEYLQKRIYLQRVGPDPALQWGPHGRMASDPNVRYHRWDPVLRSDGFGGIWIAWQDFRNQLTYQIQVNHLNSEGLPAWVMGEISVAPAPGDQGRVAMMEDGEGGVWLAWIDNRNATVGLYAQHIDDKGRRLLGVSGKLLVANIEKPSTPQIVSLGEGRAVIAWTQRHSNKEYALYWQVLSDHP